MLKKFKKFISKKTNFGPDILEEIRFFEILLTIRTISDFNENFRTIKGFDNTVNQDAGENHESLQSFLERKKLNIYIAVDASQEYKLFIKDLQKTVEEHILNNRGKMCNNLVEDCSATLRSM